MVHGDWGKVVESAIGKAAAADGWADMAAVGSYIHKSVPGFKPGNYGPSKLSLLIKSRPDLFETKKDTATIKVRTIS